MKIKHQLAIFNGLTRLMVILALWWLLPVLIEKVIYKNINRGLIEKKERFIEHIDKQEINDFIAHKDSLETYASFSTLHSEFLQLSRLPKSNINPKAIFITEPRIIEEEENDYRILQYQFIYENQAYNLEIGSSLSEINDLTLAIRMFFLVVLLVTLGITFVMDTFYIEYLLKPFYKIIDTKIRRVNEPDTFDHTPINTHSTDFRELDEVLNQMMVRISELFKKEKQFIANVSHELLTPIAILKNKFENLLQNESLDNAAVDKIVGSLKTLDLLKKVISNLLLISRIENNQYVSDENIDCFQTIEDLAVELEDRIEAKSLRFSNQLKHHYHFKGNSILMHILLYNLLVNAIKYTQENGSIIFSDEYANEQYKLLLSDTGIGLDATQLVKIFKRFTRINEDKEGHGLGLAIVDSIAHFHHITIDVRSIPKEGTTFVLTFPKP